MITNSSSVTSGAASAPDPRRLRSTPAATPIAVRADSFSHAQVASFREALAQVPAQRPEVVERAQNIAIDPNYPPLQLIERVAKLIAESQDPSEIAD